MIQVVRQAAEERHNRLLIAASETVTPISSGLWGSEFRFDSPLTEGTQVYRIPLMGAHQLNNAAAALTTVAVLRDRGLSIPEKAVAEGLRQVRFPARLELLQQQPVVLLDGAHNPGGAEALSKAIREYLPDRRKIGVVGMLADKDVRTALSMLIPLFDRIVTTTPPNPRAMSAQELAGIAAEYGVPVEAEPDDLAAFQKALAAAKSSGSDDTAVVIFGSLYLASSIRLRAGY